MIKIFKKLTFILLIYFSIFLKSYAQENKLKIGMLVPMTGDDKKIGQQIIKATRMALEDINSDNIEIYPKDTGSNPSLTLKSAKEIQQMGISVVIGPVFHKSLIYLDEFENITFLSLTNKTIDIPKNIISSGINATSQLVAIKKFIDLNEFQKIIFLTPKVDYEKEIKKAIKQSNLKNFKHYIYDTEPTKLTQQIEKITNYKIRKQNVSDEIKRIENSDLE